MLDIVTGLPHPDLEQALARHIQDHKASDPFCPLLILVPSDLQRTRLVWQLCVEADQPLLNVQVLTFFQLARQLMLEDGQDLTITPHSDFKLTECVHHLLRRQQEAWPIFGGLREIPGAWTALWATIKDLKDGTVDPEVALEALRQSEFSAQPNLESLFLLYQQILHLKQELHWYDADDVSGLARDAVGSSTFLAEQAHILYYGFYDLTQVQLDMFTRIAQRYPTTLFFPVIPRHPAFRFAQQFFDRHLGGLLPGTFTTQSTEIPGAGLRGLFMKEEGETSPTLSGGPSCQIVEVSGVDDEIGFVAKAILQQVESQGVPFHEIGVVARTLTGYLPLLTHVFLDHGIPTYSTLTPPLAEEPLTKWIMKVLTLARSKYRREHVLDVVLSPFFHRVSMDHPGQELPSDQWDTITRQFGIQHGLDQWARLKAAVQMETSDGGGGAVPSERTQAELISLWHTVSRVFEVVSGIPEEASLQAYIDTVQHVLEALVHPVIIDHPESAGSRTRWSREWVVTQQRTYGLWNDHLEELRAVGPLYGEGLLFAEFVSMLKRFLEASQGLQKENAYASGGVWVLNAMEARGLSFRVLYVMGLTENVFPRHIREDAFLRDAVRRWCNESLGYKVPEHLPGYDEEKLLFYLLVNSTSQSLILLSQRSDQSGHQLTSSSYLKEVGQCLGAISPLVVPRKLSHKCTDLVQYGRERLTPREFRIIWLLNRQWPEPGWKEHYSIGSILEKGMNALQEQEALRPSLGPYDGITGTLPIHWDRLGQKGLSPTALETYARCPFQYFMKQVLGVDPLPSPDGVHGLKPWEVGNLIHDVLTAYFRSRPLERELHSTLGPDNSLRESVTRAADPVFQAYAQSHAVGYPLVWDIQRQTIVDLLLRVIREDLREQGAEWVPTGFEESLRGVVTVQLSDGPQTLHVTGRVDRIDQSTSRKVFRIIDYKYSESTSRKISTSSLLSDVIRGSRLQPPFYLKLAEGAVQGRLDQKSGADSPMELACENVWFYRISPHPSSKGEVLTRVSFPGNAWESTLKTTLEATINGLVGGIYQGNFFMTPGPQCSWCEYDMTCHRTHQLSAWRARVDETLVTPHRRLRMQKLPAGKTRPE